MNCMFFDFKFNLNIFRFATMIQGYLILIPDFPERHMIHLYGEIVKCFLISKESIEIIVLVGHGF